MQQLLLPVVNDPAVDLSIAEERQDLEGLLEKLELPPEDVDTVRSFLTRLRTTPPRFRDPISAIRPLVQMAIFWREVKDLHLLSARRGARHLDHGWTFFHKDFYAWGRERSGLYRLSERFTQAIDDLLCNPFLDRITRRVSHAYGTMFEGDATLQLHALSVIMGCLEFALVSHFDPTVYRCGERFRAFFQLYELGNVPLAYDQNSHTALVLVA